MSHTRSRDFFVIHYNQSLPVEFINKSFISSLSSLKEYDTISIEPKKKWEDYRFDFEVQEKMHPFVKYDSLTRSCYAVNDSSTWENVGFVVGYLIFSETGMESMHVKKNYSDMKRKEWWFQEYPQVLSSYVPQVNDIILILSARVQSPPLTTHRSLVASTYTLQEAFKKFMYLPRMEFNETLREMLLDDTEKWDKELYVKQDIAPSEQSSDVLTFSREYGQFPARIDSVYIEMFLKSVSDRYFLPTEVYTIIRTQPGLF